MFLHGFLGRAETRVAGHTFEYFRGLREVVRETGIDAHVPQMPLSTGIEARAKAVQLYMDAIPAQRIILVGVSMGGLVARALACRYDPDKRIKMVATIATPHHGSPLADRALSEETRTPAFVVEKLRPALHDLTIAEARAFNARTPDRADVRYLSWAFARPYAEMPPLLRKRQQLIFTSEGPNDGLVSVKSATWGEAMPPERADHFETIGWSPAFAKKSIARPYDQQGLWRRVIAACLAGEAV